MTNNSRLIWISVAISIISLIVSILVLVNYCPTQNLQFDYLGVIVGILALLVTALIGAQVGQYVFVDKKIEKITRTLARVISRKVAQEEAREVAKMVALEVVGGLPEDISAVLKGKNLLRDATNNAMSGNLMKCIDFIMKALVEFKKSKSDVLYKSSIDDALNELKEYFEYCEKKGGVRILKGKRQEYEIILKDIRSEYVANCLEYLSKAAEKEEKYDEDVQQREIDEIFGNAMNDAKEDIAK